MLFLCFVLLSVNVKAYLEHDDREGLRHIWSVGWAASLLCSRIHLLQDLPYFAMLHWQGIGRRAMEVLNTTPLCN